MTYPWFHLNLDHSTLLRLNAAKTAGISSRNSGEPPPSQLFNGASISRFSPKVKKKMCVYPFHTSGSRPSASYVWLAISPSAVTHTQQSSPSISGSQIKCRRQTPSAAL